VIGCEIGLLDRIMPTVGGNVPYLVRLVRDTRGGWIDGREGEPEGVALVLATTQLGGIRAAKQAESTRSAVRTYLRAGQADTESLTALVREEMVLQGRAVGRVSVCCVIFDLMDGVMHLGRWGDCPVLYRPGRDGEAIWIDRRDRSVTAPMDERVFTETLPFTPDDVVLVLSRSVLDALGSDRRRFGRERLKTLLSGSTDRDATTLVDEIDESLVGFTDGAPTNSDQTLFVVKRTIVNRL
jgi:serine phosphatase RsbU (regulator of sigma subunit)